MDQFIAEGSKIAAILVVIAALVYLTLIIIQKRALVKFLSMCNSESAAHFSSKPLAIMNYSYLKKYRFLFSSYIRKIVDREEFPELWQFVHQKNLLSGKRKKICDSTYVYVLMQVSACSLARIFIQGVELYLENGGRLILDDIIRSLVASNQAKKNIFLRFVRREIQRMMNMQKEDKVYVLDKLYKEIHCKLVA